jgi:hypothetical protein
MVWSQYVYEATVGYDPDASDDEEINDNAPLNIEDWEVEYSDELHMMWNTAQTLLYDAHIEHSGEFIDFVEFCFVEHDPIIEKVSSHYEDHLFHVWENLGRILHQNGLRGEIMRGAGFNDFLAFAENYMGVY